VAVGWGGSAVVIVVVVVIAVAPGAATSQRLHVVGWRPVVVAGRQGRCEVVGGGGVEWRWLRCGAGRLLAVVAVSGVG